VLLACLAAACPTTDVDECDLDGDGSMSSECWGGEDCDDQDASIHPAADEVCADGVDNNCDGHAIPCGPWGRPSTEQADARILLQDSSIWPVAVTSVGDWDDDGLGDVAIGGAGEGDDGPGSGRVRVHAGPLEGEVLGADALFVVGRDVDLSVGRTVGFLPSPDGSEPGHLVVGSRSHTDPVTGDRVGRGAVGVFEAGQTGSRLFGEAAAAVLGEPEFEDVIRGFRASRVRSGSLLLPTAPPDTGGPSPERLRELDPVGAGLSVIGDHPALFEVDLDGLASIRTTDLALAEGTRWVFAGIKIVYELNDHGIVVGAPWADSPVQVSEAPIRLEGEAARDRFGGGLEAGDLDADGVDDLVVSAFHSDLGGTEEGAVYLYFGAESGAGWEVDDSTVQVPDREAIGEPPRNPELDGWGFGSSLALGDLDADGYLDLVVGAAGAYGSLYGCTYVYTGPLARAVNFEDFAARICDVRDDEQEFGGVVEVVADTDGDGYDDLLVGTRDSVYLFRGGPGL